MKYLWLFILGCLLIACLFYFSGGSSEKLLDVSSAPTPLPQISQATPLEEFDPLVAEWNGGKLLLSDIDKILGPQKDQLIVNASDDAHIRDLLLNKRKTIIKTLVDNYLLIQEAQARKLSLTEAQQENMIRGARSKYDSEEEYFSALQNAGQTENDLIEALSNIQLGRLCVEDEKQKIADSLTPEIMKEYYQDHLQEQFSPPACSKVNWVIIKSGSEYERSPEEAKQFANKLYADVKKKVETLDTLVDKRKVLQECARTYSDDYSGKYNYGYAILYHRDPAWSAYTKAFQDELVKINKPAELSDVVEVTESAYGFFILLNKSSSFVSAFDSPTVQNMLPNMVIKVKLEEWLEELKNKYQLKLYEEHLTYHSDSSLDSKQL